jgi:hypothetical protein
MEMVILERVREDIYENKKLNVHLFNCLKRGLYKPAGFFKGFLFPLAASGKPLQHPIQETCVSANLYSRHLHIA